MLLRFRVAHAIGGDQGIRRVAVALDLEDDLVVVDAWKSLEGKFLAMRLAGFDSFCEFGFVFGHGGHDVGMEKRGRDWSKSLLEEVQRLHGALHGTGDPLPDEQIIEVMKWIETQVECEWIPAIAPWIEYENAVRQLARAVVALGKSMGY